MSEEIQRLLEDLNYRIRLQDEDYHKLLRRYDDAQKRMNDMQAELDYLRQEVRRG